MNSALIFFLLFDKKKRTFQVDFQDVLIRCWGSIKDEHNVQTIWHGIVFICVRSHRAEYATCFSIKFLGYVHLPFAILFTHFSTFNFMCAGLCACVCLCVCWLWRCMCTLWFFLLRKTHRYSRKQSFLIVWHTTSVKNFLQ